MLAVGKPIPVIPLARLLTRGKTVDFPVKVAAGSLLARRVQPGAAGCSYHTPRFTSSQDRNIVKIPPAFMIAELNPSLLSSKHLVLQIPNTSQRYRIG